ncbi:TPA: hypothetical protein ACPJ0S_002427 [Vibrio alginolyticus]
MNNDARLYFTVAAFIIGMMLASQSVSLLNHENANFWDLAKVMIHLVGGYILVPLLVWSACTAIISKEQSKEGQLDSKAQHPTLNPDK